LKKIVYIFSCVCVFTFSALAQWSDLDAPDFISTSQLHGDNSGNLYAAGRFFCQNHDTSSCVVKWDGSTWKELPAPNNANDPHGRVLSIATYNTNHLYIAGSFHNSSNLFYVAQWNGSSWVEVGGKNALAANASVTYICTDKAGNLFATGHLKNSSGYSYVAKWNGIQWSQFGGNIVDVPSNSPNSWISQICFDKQGNLYAVGAFRNASKIYYVAKWDGNSWIELGGNNALQNNYSHLTTLISDNSGNIYTAGGLRNTENKPYVAKWNGTEWIRLTGNNGFRIHTSVVLCMDKHNNIYASGKDSDNNILVSKWNGSEWVDLAENNYFEQGANITSICTDTAGNLYATANLYKDDYCKGYIAKYSNTHLVGVEEGSAENINALLYPNPCKEVLHIRNLPNIKTVVLLYDVAGKLILSKALNANSQANEIDVSALSSGLYIAELQAEGKQPKRLKVVKE
jgi:hypothetical protein